MWHGLWSADPPAQATSVRLAIVVATIVVAPPHITRPFRKLSRWLVAGGGVALVILGATTPTGAAIGVLCAAMSAALVHLVFGTSAGPEAMSVAGNDLRSSVSATLIKWFSPDHDLRYTFARMTRLASSADAAGLAEDDFTVVADLGHVLAE